MKKMRNWIEKSKQEAIESDIETTINSIVWKSSKLPYNKQVETIERMKKQLSNKRDNLLNEANEITECLEYLGN